MAFLEIRTLRNCTFIYIFFPFFIGNFRLIRTFFHDLITGEEELQLQLALAMSREEAEQDENKSKSDDMRLQLALQKSKEEGGTKV